MHPDNEITLLALKIYFKSCEHNSNIKTDQYITLLNFEPKFHDINFIEELISLSVNCKKFTKIRPKTGKALLTNRTGETYRTPRPDLHLILSLNLLMNFWEKGGSSVYQ